MACLRRVVSALAKRVAPANPTNTLEATTKRTVLFDRLDEIRAAGRRVSAIAAQQGTNANLIHPYGKDHRIPRKAYQPPDGNDHELGISRARFFSKRMASRVIDRWIEE